MFDVYHYDDFTFFVYSSVSSISQLSRLFMRKEDMMMLLHDFPFFSACFYYDILLVVLCRCNMTYVFHPIFMTKLRRLSGN